MRSLRRVPHVAVCLALSVLANSAQAQFDTLETEDLQLLFSKATQSYLTPHVARCFQNSLNFHRELWDYTPSERVTALMLDFSDSGNAGAGSIPRNRLQLQIAPLDFSYEAISSNERMNWIMNHELVHIVAADQGADSDFFFRKFFTHWLISLFSSVGFHFFTTAIFIAM